MVLWLFCNCHGWQTAFSLMAHWSIWLCGSCTRGSACVWPNSDSPTVDQVCRYFQHLAKMARGRLLVYLRKAWMHGSPRSAKQQPRTLELQSTVHQRWWSCSVRRKRGFWLWKLTWPNGNRSIWRRAPCGSLQWMQLPQQQPRGTFVHSQLFHFNNANQIH